MRHSWQRIAHAQYVIKFLEERDIPFAMRVPRKPVGIRLDESLKKLDDLEDGPVSTYPLSDARVDTAPTLYHQMRD